MSFEIFIMRLIDLVNEVFIGAVEIADDFFVVNPFPSKESFGALSKIFLAYLRMFFKNLF
jgi:hypothetical protein